jgi:Zn2+/Cd2+-exporting ATPase
LGPEGAIVAAVVHNLSTLAGMANSGRLLLFDETDAGRRARGLAPSRLEPVSVVS